MLSFLGTYSIYLSKIHRIKLINYIKNVHTKLSYIVISNYVIAWGKVNKPVISNYVIAWGKINKAYLKGEISYYVHILYLATESLTSTVKPFFAPKII